MLSADGAMWRVDEPSLTVASRGLCGLELTLTAASKDLHSGRHGGGVANPLHAMAQLIASLHEPDGRVAVDGFYDEVRELSPAERAAIAALPYDERAYLAQVGASSAFGEPGYYDARAPVGAADARGQRHVGRLPGPGQKTVIPSDGARQDHLPARAGSAARRVLARVARHLEAHVPPGTRLSLSLADHGSRAAHVAADHFALRAADRALEATYGVRPLVVRMGGTVPIVGAVPASHGTGHRVLLLLDRRRRLPRAERVLPRAPACAKGSRRGRATGTFSARSRHDDGTRVDGCPGGRSALWRRRHRTG